MQNTNEQQQNIDAATMGQSEDLQRAVTAAQTLCDWMPPQILAQLVDEWIQESETLSLAQTALDAGRRNCGVLELATYVTSGNRPTDTCVVHEWENAGLVVYHGPPHLAEHSSEPDAQQQFTKALYAAQQHCKNCGEYVGNDNLFWENPDLPNACSLVCEDCMPKDLEDTDGSWCDEESDAERNR